MAYLLHSSILLAGFVLFYHLLLRKETFYKLNRWLFIIGIILSLCLPLVTVPAYLSFRAPESSTVSAIESIEFPLLEAEAVSDNSEEPVEIIPAESDTETTTEAGSFFSNISLLDILQYIYLGGAIIFFLVFIMQLIVLLARRYTLNCIKTGKYKIVELVKEQEPYSFLNTIFINPTSYDRETYEHIFEHEKVHVDQRHFFDKLIAELLVIIFWFNPFVWFLRSSLSKNLEFLTDYSLLKKGLPKEKYQLSLLKVSTSTQPFNLTTSYNNSFLKNRIQMMNAKRSSIASFWKYLFILPLFFISLMGLNAVQDSTSDLTSITNVDELTEDPSQTATKSAPPKKKKNKTNQKKNEKRSSSDQNSKNQTKSDKKTKYNQSNTTNTQPKDVAPNSNSQGFNSNANAYGQNGTLRLPEIRGIRVMSDIVVSIQQGDRQSVRVEGSTTLSSRLNTSVGPTGIWDIKYLNQKKHSKNKNHQSLKIYLTVKTLEHLEVKAAAIASGVGTFRVNGKMEIWCDGAGKISLDAVCDYADCKVSGAGYVALTGSADYLLAYISGSGTINGSTFIAQNSEMKVSGAGNIMATIEDSIDATVSGSGSIKYRGNPRVKKQVNGTGVVTRMY